MKFTLCVILSVVETRGGLRRVEDSEGEPFCERLGSKKRLSIALLFICYILRGVCGDNAPLARLMVVPHPSPNGATFPKGKANVGAYLIGYLSF